MGHQNRKNRKNITLEDKITLGHDKKREIADSLGLRVNTLFGGWLRQSIHAKYDGNNTYTITGYCALTKNFDKCMYVAPTGYDDACYACDIYRQHFGYEPTFIKAR